MRGKDYITEYLKKTPIQQFYSGKTIFITGGTGFVGKLIIERLICNCYDIDKIYLLIRPKKEKSSQNRLKDFLNDGLFAKLEKGWKHKIEAMEGELGENNLGLNERDRSILINNVDVVFHSGATVRFDEKLKIALKVNVIGTFDIVNLCKEMKNLKSFVHVSTAFANCAFGLNIEEKFCNSGMSLKEVKTMIEIKDQEILEILKFKLLMNWPNSYSFTKSIAEDVILKEAKDLPVIIFRPGIVLGTSGRHSVIGYTDSVFGPSGLLAAVGTGLLRLLKINKKTRTNMIPADFCANGIIASAWDISQRLEPIPPIINYIPPNRSNVLWGNAINLWLQAVDYMPLSKSVWYPCMTLAPCKYDYQIRKLFLHILPAILMDCIFKLTGEKLSLMMVYRKTDKFLSLLDVFVSRNWVFELNEMNNILSHMNLKDKNLFYNDLSALKWSNYSATVVYGIRQHLIKEEVSVLEARKKFRALKTLHIGLKNFVIVVVAIFFWMWMQRFLKIH